MDTAESRLAKTLFVVEATSFEQLALWRDCAKQNHRGEADRTRYDWQERLCPSGWLVTVGELAGMPCAITMSWVKIDGQLIAFYYDCSVVTDSRQTEKWLADNFTGKWDSGTRRAMTDANNFGHCLAAIREANAVPA